jgi:glycerophosphoryl diester phosphodiesterase
VAGRPGHPFLSAEHPIAFAHRGGLSVHPENTLPAFEHAVDLGYRYLETDVHATADGVLVAFHDDDLLRTCGIDARISNLTWKEVAEARVDGREPIPRMGDLLTRFPDSYFNIDAKSDPAVEALAGVIERTGSIERVCVASFSHRRLRRLRRRLGSGLLTNLVSFEVGVLRIGGRLPGGSARVAQVPIEAGWFTIVTPRFVASAKHEGIPVHVWTIDDPAEMHRLLDLGVDGIMTDRPEVLRDVFIDRGIWPT